MKHLSGPLIEVDVGHKVSLVLSLYIVSAPQAVMF